MRTHVIRQILSEKLTKNGLDDENFCTRNFLSNVLIQKSGKNQTKLTIIRMREENSVRRNFPDKVPYHLYMDTFYLKAHPHIVVVYN